MKIQIKNEHYRISQKSLWCTHNYTHTHTVTCMSTHTHTHRQPVNNLGNDRVGRKEWRKGGAGWERSEGPGSSHIGGNKQRHHPHISMHTHAHTRIRTSVNMWSGV